jgi:hypothetical protein
MIGGDKRHLHHKMVMAKRLRKRALKIDQQIFRMLKQKQRVLRLADKLEKEGTVPEYTVKTATNAQFGFGGAKGK